MLLSTLHMELCLREGGFDTPIVKDKRYKNNMMAQQQTLI